VARLCVLLSGRGVISKNRVFFLEHPSRSPRRPSPPRSLANPPLPHCATFPPPRFFPSQSRGVLALCVILLDAKADVMAKNNAGSTPMHVAANSGQHSIVQWLLSKEGDPNEANKAGDTPLHTAARAGFKLVVQVLLAGGAKQSTNRQGKTPLEVCVDKDCEKLLTEGGK
jgi:ankyrin repeat protein